MHAQAQTHVTDALQVYVWSLQTGNVLEVLTGHTSHVQSLHFSPSAQHPGQLVSASWDGTLNVWDLYAGTKGGAAEALQCSSSTLLKYGRHFDLFSSC